eukprot:CAMPEP_0174905548 /NCGR_PEP_ID=MMETSP0167-20121228/53374_1 /TAXON_ID=38298 /ORGANISM="Rhodella maculata, Strain CCMP736" /LENGTH=81 /DNA_ID=CAMNT_0016148519 /DNA_START=33 /DNA_END=274 /DNA_ORIENTATION=+
MSAPTRSSALYLGVDLSSQGLKATVLSSGLTPVHEAAVPFASLNFPSPPVAFGTLARDSAASPIRMFILALDTVLAQLKDA